MGGAVVFVQELHAKDIGGSKINFMNEYFNNILVCQNKTNLKTCHLTSKKLTSFQLYPPSAAFDPNMFSLFIYIYISSFMFSAIPKQPTTTHHHCTPTPHLNGLTVVAAGRALEGFEDKVSDQKRPLGGRLSPTKSWEDSDGGMGWMEGWILQSHRVGKF